jgi:hypothetical protein
MGIPVYLVEAWADMEQFVCQEKSVETWGGETPISGKVPGVTVAGLLGT